MTTKTKSATTRKPYAKPSLTTYGDIRELTLTTSIGRARDLQQFGNNSRT